MTDVADQVLSLLLARLSRAENRASLGDRPAAAGMAPAIQTRFGNSVRLAGALGGQEIKRLLECSLETAQPTEQYKAGAWVLSLESHNALGNALGGGTLGTVQVTATITIGAGGAAIPFQVSVIPGTVLQLPASTISVDVQLTGTSSQNVVVSGVIQRGFTTTYAIFNQQVSLPNAAPSASVVVPNFANGVRIIADEQSPWYCDDTRVQIGNISLRGPTFKAKVLSGNWIDIPVSRAWNLVQVPSTTMINYAGAASPYVAGVDWRIAL